MNLSEQVSGVLQIAPLVVAAAAALSAVLIVLLRPVLREYALARPNARSSHKQPTPQGGGLAVVAALLVVILAGLALLPGLSGVASAPLWPLLGAIVVLAAVGAVDDLRNLTVMVRLPLQALAVAAVIVTLPPEMRLCADLPLWLERAAVVFLGVYFVNLVNFMDGIDWITVAEVVPVTVGLAVIGALGGLPPREMLIALALLGAVVGFAPFNRPVAKLFLGDVGSLPIGLLLGWLLLAVAASGHLIAALLLPLYYLADASITLGRRLVAGERFWEAHRSHFYQRATNHGWSVPAIVSRIFAVNLGLVVLAAASVWARSALFDGLALVLGAGLVSWVLWMFSRSR